MIGLRMTGMCENCPHAKLIVECLYTDGAIYNYDVICEHEPACRRAAEWQDKSRNIDMKRGTDD